MGMHFLDYFSDDYEVARQKFLDTVKAYGLEHHAFTNPQTGPEGQILATDVAWYGNKAAEKVLVFISGTHGVEFLAGSGCQIGWIKEGHLAETPADTGILFIHCINPYGAAWRRRYNEDNVDLNRNFIDHDRTDFKNLYY